MTTDERAETTIPVRGFLFDIDGTLWDGTTKEPLPGARELLQELRDRKVPFLVVSNNALVSPELMAQRFEGLVDRDQIVTPATVLRDHIAANHPGATVRVAGPNVLRDTIASAGVAVLSHDSQEMADLCVLGDMQHGLPETRRGGPIQQRQLWRFLKNLKDPGCVDFLVTNPERARYERDGDGIHFAVGNWTDMLVAASGREATLVGKPNHPIFDAARAQLSAYATRHGHPEIPADEVVMVGDNALTDVLGGNNAGMRSVFVNTGSTRIEDFEAMADGDPRLPTRGLASVAELIVAARTGDLDSVTELPYFADRHRGGARLPSVARRDLSFLVHDAQVTDGRLAATAPHLRDPGQDPALARLRSGLCPPAVAGPAAARHGWDRAAGAETGADR